MWSTDPFYKRQCLDALKNETIGRLCYEYSCLSLHIPSTEYTMHMKGKKIYDTLNINIVMNFFFNIRFILSFFFQYLFTPCIGILHALSTYLLSFLYLKCRIFCCMHLLIIVDPVFNNVKPQSKIFTLFSKFLKKY